jgi:hypothetical protein
MSDESSNIPYRLRSDFLSPSEAAFYQVLVKLVHNDYFVCPKVALSDLFFVARPNENVQYTTRLLRKNIDFLLLRCETLTPSLAIELDYLKQVDHRPQDSFMDEVFAAAKLPLIHLTVQQTYNIQELSARLRTAMLQASGAPPPQHTDFSPICPSCGIMMVLRFDKDGPHRGQKYYGCLNFPECQETVAVVL